jgi:Prolyl oligopeptidase family
MAPFDDPDDFKARSPISYIKNVKTPMMFVLGESDTRTPPGAGGEEMFRALKFRKVPTVMVKFPGRIPRALPLRAAVASGRTSRAHRRLVRQMANGRDQAGVRRRAGSHSQTERRRRNEAAELV